MAPPERDAHREVTQVRDVHHARENEAVPHDSIKDHRSERHVEKNIEMVPPERDAQREVTQVHNVHRAGTNKRAPHDSTQDRPREPRAKKIIEIIAPERDPHRKLIQVRDVHVASRQAPSPRPIGFVQQSKSAGIPPAINVTIGRVEVRAVTPPIRERPRPKTPATMSLDDYLRRRANGDRR
jgi:hypothetical protein